MKKASILLLFSLIIVTSCVSKKKYAELEANNSQTKEELLAVETTLQKYLIEKEKQEAKLNTLGDQIYSLKEDKNGEKHN